MKVKISNSEKNSRELEIYLDGKLFQIVKKNLYKRHIVTLRKFKNFKEEFSLLEQKISYQYALSLLARRDYTAFEIRKKLSEKYFSPKAVDYALTKVKPYLRDEELIKRIIRSELDRGNGPKKILFKIKKRCDYSFEILQSWIDNATSKEFQIEKAKVLVERRYELTDQKSRQRAYRFLLSRGYTYEIAIDALK